MNLYCVIFALLGYIAGSINFALVVAKGLRVTDPRAAGSHNPGTTNMLRVGGKTAAALTLLGDGLKGFLVIMVARIVGLSPLCLGLIGFLAVVGHCFPLFNRFNGGKGIATSLGVLLAWSPLVALIALGAWMFTVLTTRYSSAGAIVATSITPLCFALLAPAFLYPSIAMTALVLFQHRDNFKRLYHGSETKI